MKPMRLANALPCQILNRCRKRARKRGMLIRTIERGGDSFLLVDARTNAVAAPTPLSLAKLEQWLDDLDAQDTLDRRAGR